jgi:hypothetical protein
MLTDVSVGRTAFNFKAEEYAKRQETCCFLLAVWLASSLTLKMEAARSSVASDGFYWSTQRRIQKYDTLDSQHSENLKSNFYQTTMYQSLTIILCMN